MTFPLQKFFDLDRKFRIWLRFIVESVIISTLYALYFEISDLLEQPSIEIHVFNVIIWVLAYYVLNLHKDRLRFSSAASYLSIFKISLLLIFTLAIEGIFILDVLDITSLLIFGLLSFNILVGVRVLARQMIRKYLRKNREDILVYGTSDVAIDLVNAMAFGKKFNAIGFISDKPGRAGVLAGLPVIPFSDLEDFAGANACKLVVIAKEATTSAYENEVLMKLDKLGFSVSYAPTIDRAFDYEVQLKAVQPESILGRTSEIQFDSSVQEELNDKTVLVTGGGGSIGSEICRQVLRYEPKNLIVLESNEFALYRLEQELSDLLLEDELTTLIKYNLGSVTDEVVLSEIFNQQKVDVVYHAAAYKHVPIVECNVIAGIINNVFGTKCVAEFAHRFGADKFVLVSTDKAVRPTNVMGASKRLAELVIQDLSKSSDTIFTMVRFGNVLGSSGSVIPKFKAQINKGGPVTVTHEEITRYFMSIPEAAHLVLNAGTFASGGEVFLLDMGEPVKIIELAKAMVRQHGLQPVLAQAIEGRQKASNEILIDFSGLRPGEKLYEELLVDGVSQPTLNPKIFKSYDGVLGGLDLAEELTLLKTNVENGQVHLILKQLQELPLSYQPKRTAEVEQTNCNNVSRLKIENSKVSAQRNAPSHLHTHDESPSLLVRLVSSKFGLSLLHRYFLLKRGLTLGVRVCLQNSDDDVLLVKHTYAQGWHLPGGGVEIGEDIETTVRREVYEETGISELTDLRIVFWHHNRAISGRDHVVYFKARTTQSPSIKRNLEISNVQFFPRNLASDIVITEHKQYILEN